MAHSRVSYVDVHPDAVFEILTDLERLPEWNRAVARLIVRPDWLVPGSEWAVEMRAALRTWTSRSTVELYDRRSRRFVYRTPIGVRERSWSQWEWDVAPRSRGARISVRSELHLRSPWRQTLVPRLQEWLVRRELPASLAALSALAVRESERLRPAANRLTPR